MNKLLALVLVLFSTLTWADNRSWSDEEKAWGYTALALTVADWAQTRDLTRRYSEGYYERNPVLGKYPSQGRVDTHFVIGGLLTYLIADNLDEYRKPFLQTMSVIELICVGNNIGLGLKVRF